MLILFNYNLMMSLKLFAQFCYNYFRRCCSIFEVLHDQCGYEKFWGYRSALLVKNLIYSFLFTQCLLWIMFHRLQCETLHLRWRMFQWPDSSSFYTISELLVLQNTMPCHSYQTRKHLMTSKVYDSVCKHQSTCVCVCVCITNPGPAACSSQEKARRPAADRESAGRVSTQINNVD